MKPAVKWGIAAASGAAILLAISKMKEENEEQNANIANNLQLIASQTQLQIIKKRIEKQTLNSDGNFKDTIIDEFTAEAGQSYLVCVSFWGSGNGTGVVGAACEGWQIRYAQPQGRDFGVNLTAVISSEQTKDVTIRALYHGSITIESGEIAIIKL